MIKAYKNIFIDAHKDLGRSAYLVVPILWVFYTILLILGIHDKTKNRQQF